MFGTVTHFGKSIIIGVKHAHLKGWDPGAQIFGIPYVRSQQVIQSNHFDDDITHTETI